jgi:hypothetical protein
MVFNKSKKMDICGHQGADLKEGSNSRRGRLIAWLTAGNLSKAVLVYLPLVRWIPIRLQNSSASKRMPVREATAHNPGGAP